jgi:putative salt-induced outer membrane protein YdiY
VEIKMRFAFAALVLGLGLSAVDAAEVHLKDGSVVIGTIKSLADGEDLDVDTEHMGVVTIDWDAINEIRGSRTVDVQLFDGRRILGKVDLNEDGLSIIGEDTLTVQLAEVFAIAEVNETFWEALDVYTDLGMNIIRGNNQVTQVSFGGGIGYNARKFEISIDGTTIINEQTDALDDIRRVTLSGVYTRKFGNNWTGSGLLQFESDDQQGLEGRSLLGGALGKRLYNNRRMRFDLFGGVALNSEEFVGQPRTETPEGLLGAAYRLRASRGIDFDVSLIVFPSLETSDRLRTQLDSSLSIDLFADFDFKLTFYDRYDSQPPVANETHDYGLTLGLSWSH